MKSRIIKSVCQLFSIGICFSGCALGGGSSGTGITGYDSGFKKNSKLSYKLEGHLTNIGNSPVSGAEVKIEAGSFNKRLTTGKDGRFIAEVDIPSGIPVKFTFKKGDFSASCTSYVSPAGEDKVSLRFKAANKSVNCP